MYDLSIIIPTCNRAELLERGLRALHGGVQCAFEVIVVDGASEDQTTDILNQSHEFLGDRLKVIRESHREGFVRAANKGFAAATGRNMTWLNDDARPLAGALDTAVQQIDGAPDTVGLLAMFHRWHSTSNVAYEIVHDNQTYRLCHVRGTLYANFALGRRDTFQRLGYFDERYFFYGADPDLSLKAWNAGLRIEPAYASIIDHEQFADDRHVNDESRGQEDNQKLFAKWNLPPRNPLHNDFDPRHPCTVLGLRAMEAIAA